MKPDIEKILSLLSEDSIAKAVSVNHDAIREWYVLKKTTVKDREEFDDEIGKYYGYHFMCGFAKKGVVIEVLPPTKDKLIYAVVSKDRREVLDFTKWVFVGYAIELLNKTYASRGGKQGAYEDARTGRNGGLRAAIDAIYRGLKKDWVNRYVDNVIRSNIDIDNLEEQFALLRELKKRFGEYLPESLRKTPELLAADWRTLRKTLVAFANLMSQQD